MPKCTKFDFRWGSTPDPLAGFKVPTSKGREAKMEGRGRMESGGKMRALLLRKGKKEVDRREGRGRKGRGRDLLDQCQTASYAPAQTGRSDRPQSDNTVSFSDASLPMSSMNESINFRCLADATTDPREATFLFQRLSVAIQRFNAACLADTFTISESAP